MNHKLTLSSIALFSVLLGVSSFAAEVAQIRAWKDSTGKYSIEATFVKFENGKVHLKKTDGEILQLSADQLSKNDQEFVRDILTGLRPATGESFGGDWLWWRGPTHNGIATRDQVYPTEWSDTKNVRWKVPVPGRGHSSPTVVGNRVIMATADEGQKIQSVVCFDRTTGKQNWLTEIHRGGFPSKIHEKNTHATQSVACDGKRLYITFYNSDSIQLTALELDGKQLWQKVVGPFRPKAYQYGYAASPLIYRSTVIIAADCDTGGYLAAYNLENGDLAWKVERPAKLSWSSPIVAGVAGRNQLLLSGCELVSSYDPENGKQLWSCAATTMATCGTMVWEESMVFASGGYPKPETVAILADGSGRIMWKNNTKCYEQSMLAYQRHIYAVDDKGIAHCWRAGDGEELWVSRLEGPVSACPILADGNIYLSNEKGTTFVFRADAKEFKLVAQNQLGTESFATPTICGGKIYLRVAEGSGARRREFLYCIGSDS